MAIVKSRINLDVNSDPLGGAENVSENNARFDINLEQPIRIPPGAFNTTIRVEEATVWNTVFNVSSGLNNNFIYITDGIGAESKVDIPDGTYSTSELSTAINREYDAQFGGTINLVTLAEDFPTQRVVLILKGTLASAAPGVTVNFNESDTFRELVGFNALPLQTAAFGADENILAPNVAAFNNIEYFLIHWNGGQGIRTNNSYNNTITRVNIDVPPGSQIVSQPFNPPHSDAQSWVGDIRNQLTFWLTNELNVEVDTGEVWSARLVFEYEQMANPPAFSAQPEEGPPTFFS